jgi:hypothetical protein
MKATALATPLTINSIPISRGNSYSAMTESTVHAIGGSVLLNARSPNSLPILHCHLAV